MSDDYIDWIAFYGWATTKAPGRPIMLSEWGWDATATPVPPPFDDGPIKSITYWPNNDEETA